MIRLDQIEEQKCLRKPFSYKQFTKSKSILAKAKEIISNDRNESHGDAFKNHAEIAEFWNIFLDGKLQPMASITTKDVAIMMILLKISRSNQGKKFNLDNFV